MKNNFVIAAVVIVFCVLAVLYFIPVVRQNEVLIRSKAIHAANELNSAAEWERWNPDLKKYCAENHGACTVSANQALGTFTIATPTNSISVVSHGAFYDIKQTGSNSDANYNYALVPSRHDDSTRLIVTEKTSLLKSLLSSSSPSTALADADSLKKFIETPSDYYGFPLTISNVMDTCVIVTRKRVVAANTAIEVTNMYHSLSNFIQTEHLTIAQPCIAHYQPIGKDSVEITAGIPIAKPLKNSINKNGFSFLEMPAKGNQIVGYYKGKFADRNKLYRAMDRFMADKLRKIVAMPYEKYLNGVVPKGDSSMVEIKVYYPVM